MPLFTGTPLRARLYSGWGLTALDIARIVGLSYATFWLGFWVLAGASFLIEPIAVPARLHLPMASARPVGVRVPGDRAGLPRRDVLPAAAGGDQGDGARHSAAGHGADADRRRLSRLVAGRRGALRPASRGLEHHAVPLPRRLPLRPGRRAPLPRAGGARGVREHDGACCCRTCRTLSSWPPWWPIAPSITSCRCCWRRRLSGRTRWCGGASRSASWRACSAAGRRTWCRRSSPSPPSLAAPSF